LTKMDQNEQKGLLEVEPESGVYHLLILSINGEMRSTYGRPKPHTVIQIRIRSGIFNYGTGHTAYQIRLIEYVRFGLTLLSACFALHASHYFLRDKFNPLSRCTAVKWRSMWNLGGCASACPHKAQQGPLLLCTHFSPCISLFHCSFESTTYPFDYYVNTLPC